MSKDRVVRVERVIRAAPQTIFELIANPALHPEIDGSGSVRRSHRSNPRRLSLGAKFGMDMRLGAPYRITNTVIEYEEGHRIAWRHFGGHIWRYELEPFGGGTKVTETFDYSGARSPLVLEILRFPARNRKGMVATLERLAGRAEEPGRHKPA